MKKFFFSVAAVAAALTFTACSSEDVVENGAVNSLAGTTGYMAFSINLPQDNGARANDDFDKGEEAEYKVHDGILLLFDGETEATAKFHSAYDLGSIAGGEVWGTPNTSVNDGNVTVDKKYVAKIDNSPAHPKAFVVLNNNGHFAVDAATSTFSIDGENFATGHPFSDLQAKIKTNLDLTASSFSTDGILMMNAHLWNQKGEGANPCLNGTGKGHLLANVDVKDIYKSKKEAEDGTSATHIFVERAVAKVTVSAASTIDTGDSPFTVAVNNWVLDNTNKSSYLVRSIEGFDGWADYYTNNKYRMVGKTTVGHSAPISQGTLAADYYRTYFAKDPNYNTDVTYGTHTNKAAFVDNAYSDLRAMNSSAYCAENTFDVTRMKYGNTTRVIFKTTITPTSSTDIIDGGFYSKPGDTKFYSQDQISTLLENYVTSEMGKLKSEGKISGTGTLVFDAVASSDHTKFNLKLVGGSMSAESTASEPEKALVAALNGAGKEYSVHTIGYDYYEGGVCYYDSRIQHFGQDHTPWIAKESGNVDEAYGTDVDAREVSYLGRWGVLRNNWYELQVSKVTKIGYAHPWNLSFSKTDNPEDPTTPPYNPETPDDNQKSELWISVDVNILSWAKRFQPVEL